MRMGRCGIAVTKTIEQNNNNTILKDMTITVAKKQPNSLDKHRFEKNKAMRRQVVDPAEEARRGGGRGAS